MIAGEIDPFDLLDDLPEDHVQLQLLQQGCHAIRGPDEAKEHVVQNSKTFIVVIGLWDALLRDYDRERHFFGACLVYENGDVVQDNGHPVPVLVERQQGKGVQVDEACGVIKPDGTRALTMRIPCVSNLHRNRKFCVKIWVRGYEHYGNTFTRPVVSVTKIVRSTSEKKTSKPAARTATTSLATAAAQAANVPTTPLASHPSERTPAPSPAAPPPTGATVSSPPTLQTGFFSSRAGSSASARPLEDLSKDELIKQLRAEREATATIPTMVEKMKADMRALHAKNFELLGQLCDDRLGEYQGSA